MNKRKKWVVILALSSLSLALYLQVFLGDMINRRWFGLFDSTINNEGLKQGKELPIPPLLEDKNPDPTKAEFELRVQYGEMEFIHGKKTSTLGYNGNYLGPTIRVKENEEVSISVKNDLNEATTVHWHGLIVDAVMDGGPHQVVQQNDEWTPNFTIEQPAATLWYHPHLLHKTGEQVFQGLAGLFIIDDDISMNLDIPKTYGVNDIPLVIQDRRFTSRGEMPYDLTMRDVMNGFLGDTVLMNGAINPTLQVKNEVIRLRLLNGSNARSYTFRFSQNLEFYQIASDGGLLEESIPMRELVLAPAERAEVLLDLSMFNVGEELALMNQNTALMTINIYQQATTSSSIPKKLTTIEQYDMQDVVKQREFVMSGSGPSVSINGKQMDMNRIDEYITLNELELWTIRNDGSRMGMGMMGPMPHPFHVHGVQFQIVERNDQKPPRNERGWKDTVLVEENQEVKVLIKFKKEGLFMYHCHILEHEDLGMMGQLMVE